ncbi:hypothetical protein HID58_080721 [Brassica napus]|uniref:Mitochondrial carrier protein n=1 Tax=Brassica napus TaxID=3708 RepID=A0ABQ7Y5P1_BRANA|nr:hypothetical protein HID58_080721 [Brassica napus]
MRGLDRWIADVIISESLDLDVQNQILGGLFLDESLPSSSVSFVSSKSCSGFGIATTEGIRGFWKGNLVNILRTAPFKSINFYAYDTYRGQILSLSGNEETTNFERFVAGAAAGVTASLLCLPLDTIRTVMVAPGGEALGGVIGAFRHMIQTEGFFSLYKARLAFREMVC